MATPKFWFTDPQTPTVCARLLAPIGRIYAAATARRLRRRGEKLDIPVICVGNINAGGTGKTPTVIALAQRLQARGVVAHIVSRGHGGTLTGPVRVDPARHTAAQTGDEPLLLAAFAPVWVSKDRADGGRAAMAAGAQAIILDDGHQNPSLIKDLTIIVVDAARGFGNGLCLPAGPLREPVAAGLARANMVLSIGSADAQVAFQNLWADQIAALPHLQAELAPLATGIDWRNRRVLAFAGIGHPEKFFDTLRGLGADLAGTEALADHQPFTHALLTRLQAQAQMTQSQLVTTEKDAARLPQGFRTDVMTLPVRLNIANPAALDQALDRIGL